jgi:hypothetical protein
MSAHRLVPNIGAVDARRAHRIYRARIVHSETAQIVVKAATKLEVGRRIFFTRVADLEGSPPGQWRTAVIWRIADNCLHLTRT